MAKASNQEIKSRKEAGPSEVWTRCDAMPCHAMRCTLYILSHVYHTYLVLSFVTPITTE